MSVAGYDRSLTQFDRHDPGGCPVCGAQLHGDETHWLEDGVACSRACVERWEIEHWDGEYVGQLELLTEHWLEYRVIVAVEGRLLPVTGTVADVDRVSRYAIVKEGDPLDRTQPETEIPFDVIERIEVRRVH